MSLRVTLVATLVVSGIVSSTPVVASPGTSTSDPLGDSDFPQGDLTAASAVADNVGNTIVGVTVGQFESPLSDNWQLARTGISWLFDANGDSTVDFDLTIWGIDGQVSAGVFNAEAELVCDAAPSWNATAKTYSATFPTSCLGNPVSFRWQAQMTYEDADTDVNSTDSAPDDGWLGPVLNEAHPDYRPCIPGAVSPPGLSADGYVALVPARVLDTRAGMPTIDCRFSGIGRVGGVDEVRLVVAGRAGVPADATAVVLNLTATDASVDGFVTVYPCGGNRPEASSLNYAAHTTVPNAVIALIAPDGTVCLFSNAELDLIADVNGYFTDQASFVPAKPSRVYDSRKVGGIRPAGSETAIGPFDGSSVVLNVTITEPVTSGYATVYPCGPSRPLASNVNFTAGTTSANAVIAKVGAGGQVCVFTSATAHLVVDINGTYTIGAGYTSLVPARLLETRSGLYTVDGLANGEGLVNGVRVLQVGGRGGVPANASAVVLNVTVADARGPGFITVFPCGSPQPNASSLNYVKGSVLPNAVLTQVGAGGKVCFYSNASTDLIVDVNGYFPAA